jgi:NitT/TauT family transport system ATP-binding protein
MEPGFVSLHGVSHRYGGIAAGPEGILAVQDLTININHGEFAAVVGPSGCGKSTLMKLATGLQFPFAGQVRVADQPVTKPVKIAGMAFQAPTLLPWRTTLENLLLPLEIVQPHRRELRRNKAQYIERAEKLLASVGLGGFGSKFPWQLSGGMQQRTSLCRALIHEPQLLMLDEPFGALDAFTREELWCVIRDLHAARGITVVLVTHDLREAVFLADRIFVMSQRPGRIVAERKIDLPRPRELEVTFTKEFQDIVQELRAHIVQARQ